MSSNLSAQTLPDATHPLGVQATDTRLQESYDLHMPDKRHDKKIPTLNQTGYMTSDRDPFTKAFIRAAAGAKRPVLDIGAAYGIAVIPALEQNAIVIANDIDPRHLLIIRNIVPKDLWPSLYLNDKRLPDQTDFPENTFDAILLCRILHFLTASEMEQALDSLHSWLAPGGSAYIVSISPYHTKFNWVLPLYNKRWEGGNPWPGVIDSLGDQAHNNTSYLVHEIPDFLHVMDERPLLQALTKRGFIIEEAFLFDYDHAHLNAESDGKGYIGIIATKQ